MEADIFERDIYDDFLRPLYDTTRVSGKRESGKNVPVQKHRI